MNNILNIIRHDLKKITGSVVAIITIMGLCLVPCCYAWFNILSNWAPYESEATSRIKVAVANMDEGANALGLPLNVGDQIVEGLEGNDQIGWVFVDSEEEAIEGVYAGDYYAALVVPEDFSANVISFISGDLTNPKLMYYENEKKNAIAPKITGKAKTAVQEQVNATFVETLAKYVSDAASVMDANGLDPSGLLSDLSNKIGDLSGDLDNCIALSGSAAGLTAAAGELLSASGTFIGSTQDVINANKQLIEQISKNLPEKTTNTEERDKASDSADDTSSSVSDIRSKIEPLLEDSARYDAFVTYDRDSVKASVDNMKKNAESHAASLEKSGYTALAEKYTELAGKLGTLSDDLAALEAGVSDDDRQTAINGILDDLDDIDKTLDEIKAMVKVDISSGLEAALANVRATVASLKTAMANTASNFNSLQSKLDKYSSSLGKLQKSINSTTAMLNSLKDGANAISRVLSNAAGSDLLQTLSGLLGDDETAVAEYLANPIKMDTEELWPVENYGSAMAPFYTVLAQWVGALLTAVLIKVKVKKRKDLTDLRQHEWYFGRYGLYLIVGVAQALIVALGDLLYVHIQCHEPLLFVLAALVNGIVFMMINYALVFALDNIGLGASVIILVMQVAGSGGTYPIEVLPDIFQKLYPFMPFRYAMDAMRECIGGMYDGTYWKCLGILGIFFVFSIVFGLLIYKPAHKLNEMIAASKAKSEIML